MRLLDHPTGGLAMAQLLGRIDAYSADDLPAVPGSTWKMSQMMREIEGQRPQARLSFASFGAQASPLAEHLFDPALMLTSLHHEPPDLRD